LANKNNKIAIHLKVTNKKINIPKMNKMMNFNHTQNLTMKIKKINLILKIKQAINIHQIVILIKDNQMINIYPQVNNQKRHL
jgi:hypothetical protein